MLNKILSNGTIMRLILFVLFSVVLLPVCVAGGSYYRGVYTLSSYDPDSGLYYHSIIGSKKVSGGWKSREVKANIDLNIYNPKTGKSRLVFNDKKFRRIKAFLFETAYLPSKRVVQFNQRVTNRIANNVKVTKRPLKDKLLVIVKDQEKKEIELWSAKKNGQGLTRITHFPDSLSWHIDVRNSTIRVIEQQGNKLVIHNHPW
jgi:hypothetical protein